MSLFEIFLISVSLSMDAMAVSMCKGIVSQNEIKSGLKLGLFFGFFQFLMPIIGYLLGATFSNFISKIDHYIVFILLSIISFNMIQDSKETKDDFNLSFNLKEIFILSFATSIDALAVGISYAFLDSFKIIFPVIIGIVCFTISFISFLFSYRFRRIFKGKESLVGGIIIFLIGLKILLEHLDII